MNPSKGLRERLATATTEGQIAELLRESARYADASPATRRAWVRTADRRRHELASKK